MRELYEEKNDVEEPDESNLYSDWLSKDNPKKDLKSNNNKFKVLFSQNKNLLKKIIFSLIILFIIILGFISYKRQIDKYDFYIPNDRRRFTATSLR